MASISPGGGGGLLNKVLYGDAPPRGPTPYQLTLLFTICDQKGNPFVYRPLKNVTPFTLPTLEHCIPFLNHWNAVNGRTILGENSITGRDVNQKSILLSNRNILIKGPFKYLNDRFPYPFISFSS